MNENYEEDIKKLKAEGFDTDNMTGYELACHGVELYPERPVIHPHYVVEEALKEDEARDRAELKRLLKELKK